MRYDAELNQEVLGQQKARFEPGFENSLDVIVTRRQVDSIKSLSSQHPR